MADSFDPYLRWLGIRDPERPPNHYRLLGLDLFESDPDVIAVSADRQMAHVRTFQAGKQGVVSQRLLNELAAARVCLLKPEKKAAFDEQLRRRLAAAAATAVKSAATTPPAAQLRPRSSPPTNWIGVGLAAALLMAAGIIWLVNHRSGTAVDADQRSLAARPSPADRASGTAAPPAGKSQPAQQSAATTVEPAPPAPTDDAARPLAPRDNPTGNLALVETPPQPVGIQDEPAVRATVAPDESKEHPQPGNPNKTAENFKTAERPKVPAAAAPKRSEPPGKEAQDAADKLIQELFRAEFDQANRGAADLKLALAKKLLQQAIDTSDDPAGRFVLFQRAREYAAAAGNVPETMKAIDKLAERFLIDAPAEKFASLSAMAKSLRLPEAAQAALDAALAATDDAITGDNYDIAAKLVRIATGLAAKLHNPQLVAQLKPRPAEIEQLKKEFSKTADALEKLKSNPDDPEANFLVGNFQGPLKGDFEKALPYLAKGSDATLKDLATKELAAPADPAEQAKIADGWWDASEHLREPIKLHFRAHAVDSYRRLTPALKGLSKLRAEALIKQFESEGPSGLGLGHNAIVRFLTDGDWRITWFTSTTQYAGPVSSEYRNASFNSDGTCLNPYAPGRWKFLDGATIEGVFKTEKLNFVQRFHIVGDSLQCEHFDPPGTLRNLGLGTKNSSQRSSN